MSVANKQLPGKWRSLPLVQLNGLNSSLSSVHEGPSTKVSEVHTIAITDDLWKIISSCSSSPFRVQY